MPAGRAAFRDRVRTALSPGAWVCDGNYHVVRDLVWSRADTVGGASGSTSGFSP